VAPGRPLLVNVWASWCGPCREELPLLERARVAAAGRVAFLGVDVRDARSRALTFLAAHPVGYPQLFDPDGAVARALRFAGVPDTVIVDRTGRVIYRHAGQLDAAALQRALARAGAKVSLQ
jgi:DsbE subfamily thiol:disulfide oxidoreductase